MLQRFGVEGCEALLPGMREVARVCAGRGARQIFVGMPHRGRLNVLCTLLGKPPGALFAQMNNTQSQFHVGDVKYHLGQSATLSFPSRVRRPIPRACMPAASITRSVGSVGACLNVAS